MNNTYRTHTCGQLNKQNVGETVKLSGWIFRRRDHGGVVFIDLRDNAGVTQVVFHPEHAGADAIDQVTHMSLESVICVEGKVLAREEGQINPNMVTGDIEIDVATLTVLNKVESLPYNISDESTPEEMRLKYRFLDLRTERMHAVTHLRSDIISSMRKRMWDLGFKEFNTPILTASSPEGARDFLVPSRLHPGKFYALPQAPQQFKQLLMVSGFDKYFQIAPCFRDEDPRADRSPTDFYQLDLEMSFASQQDVFDVIENVVGGVFDEFKNWNGNTRKVDSTWQQIPYAETMLKYASDKPDLRNPLVISDVSETFLNSDFGVFKSIVENGGHVRAIPAPKAAAQSRGWFDKLGSWFQKEIGAPAAPGYISKTDEGYKGPLLKFLTTEQVDSMFAAAGLGEGDVLFFVAAKGNSLYRFASTLRDKLGALLELIDQNQFKFAWIVDYPMFEMDEATGKVDFSHNPFSMPQGGMAALETDNHMDVKAYQYDLVCNGYELLSGAVRNHEPRIMYKAFEIAGYTKELVDTKFAGLINAFKHGAPPHAGAAPGIERIIMLLAGTTNIREVITFPANGQGMDVMMGSPSEVSPEQLKELCITHRGLPQKEQGAA